MKTSDLLKKRPKPPTAPKSPSAPTPPNGTSTGSQGGIPNMKSLPKFAEMLMGKSGSNRNFSNMDISEYIKNTPLDKYKDSDGNITCPVSKEERDALRNKIK